jgi:hypothetical protein
VAIQALTEDDLDKIMDQVKEVTDEAFEQVVQKQEEMHSDVQAQIVALRQILETTRITPVRIGEQEKMESMTEAQPMTSHPYTTSREHR